MEAEIAKGLREPEDITKVSLSAWTQQNCYYKAKGMVDADPRTESGSDLLHQLRRWKLQNEEITLMGDFNQNTYTSIFAQQLAEDDLGMEEQYQKTSWRTSAVFVREGGRTYHEVLCDQWHFCQKLFHGSTQCAWQCRRPSASSDRFLCSANSWNRTADGDQASRA